MDFLNCCLKIIFIARATNYVSMLQGLKLSGKNESRLYIDLLESVKQLEEHFAEIYMISGFPFPQDSTPEG